MIFESYHAYTVEDRDSLLSDRVSSRVKQTLLYYSSVTFRNIFRPGSPAKLSLFTQITPSGRNVGPFCFALPGKYREVRCPSACRVFVHQ